MLDLTKKQVEEIVRLQIEIGSIADVEYMMYYQKQTFSEFWGKWLPWNPEEKNQQKTNIDNPKTLE